MDATDDLATTRAAFGRLRRRALIVGGIALVAAFVGAFLDPSQALRSWLVAWLFWLGVALGSTALLLVNHVTGGAWGLPIRRFLQAAMRTLPLVGVMAVPLLIGVRRLYPWAGETGDHPLEHALPEHARLYLDVRFFTARSIAYLALWIGLAFVIDRGMRRHDANPSIATERRLRSLAGPGVLVYGLTMTFAAIDWGMSLEPEWHSTMYGVLYLVGQLLTGIAFVVVAGAAMRTLAPFRETFTKGHLHDLGNLTLAFVLMWSYVSFSQFLIIWSANLPEEATWYVRRSRGGWQVVAMALTVLHFAVPFLVLLSRKAKRSARVLAGVAAVLLAMRLVDLHWLLAPSFRARVGLHWLDLVMPVAIGGPWLAFWLWRLDRRPLTPPVHFFATVGAGT